MPHPSSKNKPNIIIHIYGGDSKGSVTLGSPSLVDNEAKVILRYRKRRLFHLKISVPYGQQYMIYWMTFVRIGERWERSVDTPPQISDEL